MSQNAQNSRTAVTNAWSEILREPPDWRFFIDATTQDPVMFDKGTDLGIAYSQTQRCWTIGHVVPKPGAGAEFVYFAGPFETLTEGTAALIGAAAHHRALHAAEPPGPR
jgi:hypothetical protein